MSVFSQSKMLVAVIYINSLDIPLFHLQEQITQDSTRDQLVPSPPCRENHTWLAHLRSICWRPSQTTTRDKVDGKKPGGITKATSKQDDDKDPDKNRRQTTGREITTHESANKQRDYPTPAAAVVLAGKYFHLDVIAHYEGEGAGRKLEYPEKTNLNPGSPLQWWPTSVITTTHYATGRHNDRLDTSDRPWKVQYAKIARVILFKTAGEICFNTVWVLSIRVQSNSLICTCLGGILCLLVWQCSCIKVLKTLAKTRAHIPYVHGRVQDV